MVCAYTSRLPCPPDDGLRGQVEARGRMASSPDRRRSRWTAPAGIRTASHHQRWPAVFHAQNELQRLAQEPEAVEDVLFAIGGAGGDARHPGARRAPALAGRGELARAVRRLAKLDEDLADAEQACERSRKAAGELAAFSDAGIEDLHRASRDLHRWREFADAAKALAADLDRIRRSAESLDLPEADGHLARGVAARGGG